MIYVAALCSALWLHSKFQGIYITCITDVLVSPGQTFCSHQRALQSSNGRMWISYERAELIEEYNKHSKRLRWVTGVVRREEFPTRYEAPQDVQRFGVDWHWKNVPVATPNEQFIYQQLFISVPYWLIVSVSSLLALVLSIRPWRERRRMRKGLCPACGYDVRATPDHCPECGLGIASA